VVVSKRKVLPLCQYYDLFQNIYYSVWQFNIFRQILDSTHAVNKCLLLLPFFTVSVIGPSFLWSSDFFLECYFIRSIQCDCLTSCSTNLSPTTISANTQKCCSQSSLGSSVSAGTRLRAGRGGVQFQVGAMTGFFFCLLPLPDRLWDHPAPYPMGTGALSPGVKRSRREADHLPPSSAEGKNAWSYTPTSQNVSCCSA
jgi:hypothetical protein